MRVGSERHRQLPTTNDYWSHVNSHNMTNGNGKYFEYPWSINKNVEITWVNDFNAHSITFDNEVNVSVWVDYPINTLHMSSRASKLLCAWCVWSHATIITDDDANLPFNNEDDELISIRLTILHLNDLFTEKISVPSVEPFTYRRLSQPADLGDEKHIKWEEWDSDFLSFSVCNLFRR